eukprot:TRINITY_DN4848_c0_g4_i1.p1 TRINITY_DN4848_c0_g4~~TRINITY_DN4848_c0_g4_i1.p1  ORF type:complete len:181 (-),score=24.00 TRINITY_DN4848_c0_g4_i1:51-542(-)
MDLSNSLYFKPVIIPKSKYGLYARDKRKKYFYWSTITLNLPNRPTLQTGQTLCVENTLYVYYLARSTNDSQVTVLYVYEYYSLTNPEQKSELTILNLTKPRIPVSNVKLQNSDWRFIDFLLQPKTYINLIKEDSKSNIELVTGEDYFSREHIIKLKQYLKNHQ